MPLAGRRNEGASSFLVESKLLLCTNTDEVNAGIRSPDILAGNRNTQDESVLVSLGCYDQLREKLAHTEAVLAHAEFDFTDSPDVRSPKTKTRPVACRLERGSSQSEGRRGSTARRTARLTRREQQIVNLLLEGCDNAEIAGQLRIAQRTVKAYCTRPFSRFGITSGIKRVKLATCMYRSRLCSDMIFTGSAAQLNGTSASSRSSTRASVTGTSPAKLEPPSTSSRTVFEPSTTSWVCGTVSSLPCGTGREVATAGRTHVGAREPGIFPSGQLMPAKPGGCVGTWMFLTRAYK